MANGSLIQDSGDRMISRVRHLVRYRLERALIRGPLSRLLVIGVLILLVSLVAGGLVYLATPGFKSISEAVWWAFLRLSDPGYLGDDQGALKRTVSTIVTILGYVLFMGALIAIMTQWLMQTLRNLEQGLTPIVAQDHLVILGWSNRTAAVLQELLSSEGRVRRFLQRRGARHLRVALLAEEVSPQLRVELQQRLGSLWHRRQIVLRSGNPLRLDHLRRVDFAHAAAILLPGREQGSAEPVDTDTQAIKILVSIDSAIDPLAEQPAPLVVAEIHDAREIPVARKLYKGPAEIIASGQLVGRLIAQTVRHPGLSYIYSELLQHDEDNEIYIRNAEGLAGARLSQLFGTFPRAVPIGIVRHEEGEWVPRLGLDESTALQESDGVVLVARSYEEAAPVKNNDTRETPVEREAQAAGDQPSRRILLLGWNQRSPALIGELDSFASERFEIKVVSMTPIDQREISLDANDIRCERIRVEHVELDSTNLSHLRRVEPGSYDNVVMMASERVDSEAESDARTILSYLLFREIVPAGAPEPKVLVELVDPQNADVFETRASEVIVSPLIVSHMLAQVALRRELRGVFDELFAARGPEIIFRPAARCGLAGSVAFSEIQVKANGSGQIALGVRAPRPGAPRGGVILNPPRDERLELRDDDEIIVVIR